MEAYPILLFSIEPVSLVILLLALFFLGILSFPIFLKMKGSRIFSQLEWERGQLELQTLKTNFAVSEERLKEKLEKENLLESQISLLHQNLDQIRAEAERDKTTKDIYAVQISELKSGMDNSFKEIIVYRQNIESLKIENERIKEYLRAEIEKFASQKIELQNIGEKFEVSFRNLANNILEERTQKFDEHQKTSLKHIIEPLQKDMENFKKDFTEKFSKESTQIISLGSQIEMMMKMSNKLSDEAHHLTQALKGQVKQQGNWGEAILESILQFAGLQKGVQYFVQESITNEDGARLQPDIRVQYPDNRHIIIDSKVSLIHYERYSNSEIKEEKERHLDLLVNSIKSHINDLSSKNYQDTRDNTLDFVMMFIPVEGAFITAMQADHELWQVAYKKRILLISPTNLITAMKLVGEFWQKDQNHKKSEEIASKAAGLYEKLVGFVESFEKIGESLDRAGQSFLQAKNQMTTGKGNLISRAEQLKRLNIKTGKSLPPGMVSQGLFEDGLNEEDISISRNQE